MRTHPCLTRFLDVVPVDLLACIKERLKAGVCYGGNMREIFVLRRDTSILSRANNDHSKVIFILSRWKFKVSR